MDFFCDALVLRRLSAWSFRPSAQRSHEIGEFVESLKSKAQLITDVRKGEKLDSSAMSFAFQGF
jgi:hypothetical protein